MQKPHKEENPHGDEDNLVPGDEHRMDDGIGGEDDFIDDWISHVDDYDSDDDVNDW